jgi:hypothetical protein
LAGGVGSGARRIAALLRGGDLLLEILRFARVEAQFRHWDGGHVHIILRTWSARPVGDGSSKASLLAAEVEQRYEFHAAASVWGLGLRRGRCPPSRVALTGNARRDRRPRPCKSNHIDAGMQSTAHPICTLHLPDCSPTVVRMRWRAAAARPAVCRASLLACRQSSRIIIIILPQKSHIAFCNCCFLVLHRP